MSNFVVSNSITEIKDLVDNHNYIPIECSIGSESIVDEFMLDHHGIYSHLSPVSVRGYQIWGQGIGRDVVIAGKADADAAFAAASLLGLIPHPNFQSEGMRPDRLEIWQRDWSDLAETIGKVDVNPVGYVVSELPYGSYLLVWNALTKGYTNLDFTGSVSMWVNLLTAPEDEVKPFLDSALVVEQNRISAELKDMYERGQKEGYVFVVKYFRTWGFPQWYTYIDGDPEKASSWVNPIVMGISDESEAISVGCPNDAVARELFGVGGLNNIFSELQPEGWGGRESIGGSLRGVRMDISQLYAAANKISELVASRMVIE
jgi:hypothetical protein